MRSPQSLREVSRALRRALEHPDGSGAPMAPLDVSGLIAEPPRIRLAVVVESASMQAVAVAGEPVVGFSAFLDGVQSSHVEDYAGTVPIIVGRTAAVIRARVERRMTTWGAGARSRVRLYAPVQLLPDKARRGLEASGLEVRDTLSANEEVTGHPVELMRRAVDSVKDDRESLERELAEEWASSETAPLFVDGGLPLGPLASASPGCVGVIKSHQTIYTPVEGLTVVLGLAEGERSSVVLIERTWGPQVLSWYLRLRTPPSHDPFLGLVRVEVARGGLEGGEAVTSRANEVSLWILAERAPLSLPDARWDRMVYGIRDCEEYLRAVAG